MARRCILPYWQRTVLFYLPQRESAFRRMINPFLMAVSCGLLSFVRIPFVPMGGVGFIPAFARDLVHEAAMRI